VVLLAKVNDAVPGVPHHRGPEAQVLQIRKASMLLLFIFIFGLFPMLLMYLFTCFAAKYYIFDSDDEYVAYYMKAKGKKPSKSRIFFRVRGLHDLGFSCLMSMKRDKRLNRRVNVMKLMVVIIYVGYITILLSLGKVL